MRSSPNARVPVDERRRLTIAAAAAAALLAGTAIVVLARRPIDQPPAPDDFAPLLLGLAGLCVFGLAAPRSAAGAWLSCICTALFSAAAMISEYAVLRSASPPESVPLLEVGLALRVVVVAPAAIALAYAVEPRRLFRPWARSLAVLGLAALTVVLGAGFVQLVAGMPAESIVSVPQLVWLLVVAGIVALGVAGDVEPALGRARDRLRADPTLAAGPLARLRLLVDELLPWRDVTRREVVEHERARIAADLHAEILPALRRALASAEAGGSAERLAADLRAAVDDVEDLLAARRSIVLEELGLVAALEWLAERIEDRSDVRVALDVAEGADPVGRPPRPVERAGFRIAQLALDNVVRHAPASRVRVIAAVERSQVRLVVEDDGPGMDVTRLALVDGRRGLADMRAEAAAVGGSLLLGTAADGRGTLVEFAWRA